MRSTSAKPRTSGGSRAELATVATAMVSDRVIRWWPAVGVVAMIVLGLVVGPGSTRLDDWFLRAGDDHPNLGVLRSFTDPRALVAILAASVAVALARRAWRLAAVVVGGPAMALIAVRICKPLFGREKEGALAYPSGHVTVTVVVVAMAVLVAGVTAWAVAVAVVVAVLGALGQAFTYHYFTDTVGAILLATAVLALTLRAAGLDRCQPACDLRHSDG